MDIKMKFLSVSQINDYIKMMMDSNPILQNVWIRAEISNFTNHYRTGHFYFSLKDEGALIRAVMFKSYAQRIPFAPKDGMKVLVHGRISAFVRDGQYQVYVDEMHPDGEGALYLAFEQLKKKLEAQGLFDEERKKPLPRIPERIGIITSPTGAAIQDMINILTRRFPCAEVYIYPSLVQGSEATTQLIEGIEFFNKRKNTDVIIIGRGGGSAEDLWAFNDERLAYSVAASRIPVISAVGHESDFTICDFVADKRAPTPSAAAELAVPDAGDIYTALDSIKARMSGLLLSRLAGGRRALKFLSEARVLNDPSYIVNDKKMDVLHLSEKLDTVLKIRMDKAISRLSATASKLEVLSPLAVVARGYGVVFDENGNAVKRALQLKHGEQISIKMNDGVIEACVNGVKKENKNGSKTKKL